MINRDRNYLDNFGENVKESVCQWSVYTYLNFPTDPDKQFFSNFFILRWKGDWNFVSKMYRASLDAFWRAS